MTPEGPDTPPKATVASPPGTPPDDARPGLAKARGEEPAGAAPAPEREPAYRVALPAFEGPLDLLLHLIQKHELDILDIPISFVTEKYVEYIMLMQELNIDIASEYLVMAATLAHIKSRSLLPPSPDDADQEAQEEEDPRAELVRRLLEYQKYKLAAEQLGERSVLGRDLFPRGAEEAADEGPAPLAPVPLFKLLDAFQAALTRVSREKDHEIQFERFSITERIHQLSDVLRTRPNVTFDDLFESARSKVEIIVTFLALLEMTRLRMTNIRQEGPYQQIYIELSVQEDASVGESQPGTTET